MHDALAHALTVLLWTGLALLATALVLAAVPHAPAGLADEAFRWGGVAATLAIALRVRM
ncbi:hypothetical protein [Deinococcus pimensis]|uniref:hypothetical protein n=1 Tax=Deinococcus pimensis TaxID=309888 RepID=UPI0004B1D545|nr:hypothetical protein [Deinococcus pimensis]